jgi:SAM-dependent methyltransferase
MESDQKRWDQRFKGMKFAFGKKANSFLRRHIALLPKGKALDLAAGEGRNAVFLAQHGFDVDAVDISKKGLKKAQQLARKEAAKILRVSYKALLYKIKRYLLSERKAPINTNNDYQNYYCKGFYASMKIKCET